MRTIFVTGSDTGIGKTQVVGAVGRLLWKPGLRLQFVKPVETGRAPDEPGDADTARSASGVTQAECFTLVRFRLPLAPLAAAEAEGARLSLDLLLEQWERLPSADLRIVEGAGGIAVPLGSANEDWRDFAKAINPDRMILVVADRLGAINQARLAFSYAAAGGLPAGIWLNENQPQSPEVRQSNRDGLRSHPVWATQRHASALPEDPEKTTLFLTAPAQ